MCGRYGLKLDELLKLDTPINRSFALPLHSTYHKATQSIGWEPVDSTNCTKSYLAGVEYDDQPDGEKD